MPTHLVNAVSIVLFELLFPHCRYLEHMGSLNTGCLICSWLRVGLTLIRSLSYKNPSSGKRSTEPFGKRDSQKILGEGRFSKLAPFPFSCLIKIHLPGRHQLISSHTTHFYGSSSLQSCAKKFLPIWIWRHSPLPGSAASHCTAFLSLYCMCHLWPFRKYRPPATAAFGSLWNRLALGTFDPHERVVKCQRLPICCVSNKFHRLKSVQCVCRGYTGYRI